MNRKSLTVVSVLGTFLYVSSIAQAFNIYRVGDVVYGQEYNDLLDRWIDRDFSLWVGVDENNNEHLYFKADTGVKDATVRVDYTKAIKNKFVNALSKAIEWSDIAKKNNADASKGLGCFGDDEHNVCEGRSNAFKKGQMSLKFFSARGGKQTNLIIKIIDRSNQFYKATIYMDPPEIKKLISVASGIDKAFEKAQDTAKKQELFK